MVLDKVELEVWSGNGEMWPSYFLAVDEYVKVQDAQLHDRVKT